MGVTTQNIGKLGYRYDVIGTLPKATAATEKMIAYGTVRGRGASFYFSPDIIGKNFKITDTSASSVTEKTVTFVRSDFANPAQPTLAEIVAKLNSVWDDDGTPTVASAGATGNLVVTAAATSSSANLSIGNGTANLLLGFLPDNITVTHDNGVGLLVVLPAQFLGVGYTEHLYNNPPRVTAYTYTPSTGVRVQRTTVTVTWTPSTRTLSIVDTADAASAIHAVIEF